MVELSCVVAGGTGRALPPGVPAYAANASTISSVGAAPVLPPPLYPAGPNTADGGVGSNASAPHAMFCRGQPPAFGSSGGGTSSAGSGVAGGGAVAVGGGRVLDPTAAATRALTARSAAAAAAEARAAPAMQSSGGAAARDGP